MASKTGTVKTDTRLAAPHMQPATRSILGHAAFGLLIGAVIFPFFYLWSVRSKTAELKDPTWTAIFLCIFFLPMLVLALVGWNRARNPAA